MSNDALERMQRRLERERQARLAAEELLENKSRELYTVNQELHDLVAHREEQVRERTRELEEARDQALAHSRAKSQFLANMSHEMRTPLNGVLGMLSAAAKTTDRSRQQYLLVTASQSGHLLLALINDLLDVARFESGSLQLNPVPANLTVALAELMSPFAMEAERRGLELICEVDADFPVELMVDEIRIKQLVCNLLGNAVKFTSKGFVCVSLSYVAASALEICVSDSGIGVAAEQLTKIFEPFVQADASITRNYGGTGLGLAICQKIVTAMQGQMRVSSQPGVGTQFCVHLPVEVVQPAQLPSWIPPQRNKLVLVLLVQGQKLRAHLKESLGQLGLQYYQVAESWADIHWNALQSHGDIWLFLDARCISSLEVQELTAYRDTLPGLNLVSVEMPGSNGEFPGPADGHLFYPLTLHSLLHYVAHQGSEKPVQEIPVPRFQGQHVLVVEDNDINYQVLSILLEPCGLRLSWAENGERALALFVADVPALVLMDVQMPVMDGLTATRHIRALGGAAAGVPIIAMTAHAFEEDREKSRAAGMNDHLTKPIEPEKLFRLLQHYLAEVEMGAGKTRVMPVAVSHDEMLKMTTPEGPALPGFDIPAAVQRVGGDWKALRKFIVGFCVASETVQNDLQVLMGRKDIDALKSLVHKLKGTASTLGAVRLAHAATEIESHIKINNTIPSPDLVQEFNAALAQARQASELLDSPA